MPIPHEFIPGEVARAAEVNDNFAYIMSILGPLSTPGRVETTTEFLMGARKNVLFTGTHDTGADENAFFQIGYNADWNYSAATNSWKFQRFINQGTDPNKNTAASALRLGAGSMGFWGTSSQSGNLNSSMVPVFKIQLSNSSLVDDYIYIPKSIHLQNVDEVADQLNDYRLTYVPLETPGVIYDGVPLSKSSVAKKATDYGASRYAKAIQITCAVTADTTEDAQIKFFQMRSSPSLRYGFQVSANAGKRASGQGIVHLGVGGYEGQFYISRDAAFDAVFAYVIGYWI
jgi:hypothetical protein